MAASERINCYLVLSVTMGHEPQPELDYDGTFAERSGADAKRTEIEEETGSTGISVDGATRADVVEVDCAKLMGDVPFWIYQPAYGGIPEEPTLYLSFAEAEKALRAYAEENGLKVEGNVGGGMIAEGDSDAEARIYGPVRFGGKRFA